MLAELRAGRKQSHWMWYVFPQLRGLGRSPTAERYGLDGLAEARAYLAHPVLGARLRDCAGLLLAAEPDDPEAILGPVDALKLRSSMTLFDQVEPGAIFRDVLRRFYAGSPDSRTLELLADGKRG
ncbi:MAG: DUF1810 domain-containing protein [Rhodobacteraceae bacterium]|nr:DUF1810 domain-containing protein [Paracoccaceae bacterium]